MRLGECLIETELGSVDLGIRSQLGEIERGFFDRAGPDARATNAGSTSAARTGDSRAQRRPETASYDTFARKPPTPLLGRLFCPACSNAASPGAGVGKCSKSVGQTIESSGPAGLGGRVLRDRQIGSATRIWPR
jgi:hypothetical protein